TPDAATITKHHAAKVEKRCAPAGRRRLLRNAIHPRPTRPPTHRLTLDRCPTIVQIASRCEPAPAACPVNACGTNPATDKPVRIAAVRTLVVHPATTAMIRAKISCATSARPRSTLETNPANTDDPNSGTGRANVSETVNANSTTSA